jgi:hypothetical protein
MIKGFWNRPLDSVDRLIARIHLETEYKDKIKELRKKELQLKEIDIKRRRALDEIFAMKQDIYRQEINHEHVLFGV